MKQYSSRTLQIISWLFLLFPVTYLAFVAVLFDVPTSSCIEIIFSPGFYLVGFVCCIAGFMMREMHHLVWYVFASGNVLLVLFNINVLVSYSASAHKWLAFFVSSLLIGWMVFRIRLEVKVPYFMPKIKWWEADPAAQFSLAVNLTGEGISMGAECLDISKKGCFLKVKDRLQIDDSINLELKLSGEILSIPGIVVESSEASVTRPRGIGVKFVSMPKQKKKKLGMLVQKEMDAFKKSSEVQLKKETLDQKSV